LGDGKWWPEPTLAVPRTGDIQVGRLASPIFSLIVLLIKISKF
jgi:hypothetical protein